MIFSRSEIEKNLYIGCPSRTEVDGSMVRINRLFHLLIGIYYCRVITHLKNCLGHPSTPGWDRLSSQSLGWLVVVVLVDALALKKPCIWSQRTDLLIHSLETLPGTIPGSVANCVPETWEHLAEKKATGKACFLNCKQFQSNIFQSANLRDSYLGRYLVKRSIFLRLFFGSTPLGTFLLSAKKNTSMYNKILCSANAGSIFRVPPHVENIPQPWKIIPVRK